MKGCLETILKTELWKKISDISFDASCNYDMALTQVGSLVCVFCKFDTVCTFRLAI
jgi:hypothetical protein